jgi:4-hydroxy-tetrahydrodipicolinate synthase
MGGLFRPSILVTPGGRKYHDGSLFAAQLRMFQGPIVALITPMDRKGRVELERLPRLLDHVLDGGATGVVAAGTTGESATLEADEFEAVLEAIVGHIGGRVPVLAGTGSASTAQAVAQTRTARRLGADGALVVTPYYNRPTQAGLKAHYEAIATAADIPVMLYNVPSRTAVDLLPETVEQLAGHPGIVAIKEAVPRLERVRELLDRCGDRIDVLSGDDETFAEAVLAGASGVISVAANLVPDGVATTFRSAEDGDAAAAQAARQRLQPLLTELSAETNPIPVKWGAYELGLAGPGIRLPLLPLTEQRRPALRAALESLGLVSDTEA